MNEQNPENPTQSDTKSDTPTNKSDTIRPFRQRKTTTKERKAFMLEVLENQLGIVSVACKQVGISRETHYHWVKKDPKYAKAVAEIVYNVKDFGEHALFKLIKEGNPMIVWNFNKTRNRDRGYGEHIGIEHTNKDREHIFNIIVKSNEEIRAEKEHKNTQKSA